MTEIAANCCLQAASLGSNALYPMKEPNEYAIITTRLCFVGTTFPEFKGMGWQLCIGKGELMNDGMKAVISGITAGLVTAAICAIGFGVFGGDDSYDSWTVKASLGISVCITSLVSVRATQRMLSQQANE